MKKSAVRSLTGLGVSTALAATLVGCSVGGVSGGDAPDGPVTITVSNMPPAGEAEARALFDERVAAFESANPDITVEGNEMVWDPATFGAQLAGGTLPTVMQLPFTELQGLISRGQVADITDALGETGLVDDLNPTTLSVAQDTEGRIYAVPLAAYSVGLVYNRELFEQAGLDPDVPPATWDEVREYADKISEASGVAGFAQMSAETSGGWQFTAETYSFGGRMQSEDGKTITFNDAPATEFLELLSEMRWEDESMGSNFLYTGEAISAEFAAGRIGMYIAAPDAWKGVVVKNKFAPEKFGAGPMPRGTASDGFGTMAGGNSAVVNPDASSAEQVAAVKWIEFAHLRQYVDEEAAVADAEANAALGKAVGLPGLTVMSDEAYEQYQEWIADYTNVPMENFAPYLEAIPDQPIIMEPINKAQDIYFALSTVIQTVVTDQNASIEDLLSTAAENLQTQLDRG